MCEALDLPLLGRIPFDRKLARTFDKGIPLLDATYPTIQRYHEIAGRIRTLVDYKKVLANKL
jgi:ATP-binding protein involved in chromosome partitioning